MCARVCVYDSVHALKGTGMPLQPDRAGTYAQVSRLLEIL